MTIRSFIAAPVPATVREAIAEAIEPLAGLGDVRWTRPEQFHLTLKFLGGCTPRRLERVTALLEGISNKRSKFMVEFSEIGAFPRAAQPRVVWLGIATGAANIRELAGCIDRACVAVGLPRERRPFRAHLTLGRLRSPRDLPAFVARLQEARVGPFEPFWVEEVHLMESELTPEGAVHTVRRRFSLIG